MGGATDRLTAIIISCCLCGHPPAEYKRVGPQGHHHHLDLETEENSRLDLEERINLFNLPSLAIAHTYKGEP